MVDLSTSIGPLKFSLPVFNASGLWCRNKEELEKIATSKSGAVIFKSFTPEAREGNAEPRLFFTHDYSINSIGLANHGPAYYCEAAAELKHYGKPLIASIAGFKESDYLSLVEQVDKAPFDGIEVNLSCPNVEGKGIFCFDIPVSLALAKKLRAKTKKTLGVKLSPYSDRDVIRQMAEGLVESGVDFVTLTNTFPLAAAIGVEDETMKIKPNGGIGGLGGRLLKPISLAQVVLFRQFSKGKLPIVGVGGVYSGNDAYEFILAGATAVHVGTSFGGENTAIFDRLEKELTEILRKKNVAKLSDKIGALKFL